MTNFSALVFEKDGNPPPASQMGKTIANALEKSVELLSDAHLHSAGGAGLDSGNTPTMDRNISIDRVYRK